MKTQIKSKAQTKAKAKDKKPEEKIPKIKKLKRVKGDGKHSVKGDGCAAIARLIADSEKALSTDQVRILRALNGVKAPVNRGDIKELVGIGRTGLYSGTWLKGLHDLESRKLIRIEIPKIKEGETGSRAHLHSITAQGMKYLGTIEKIAEKQQQAE